MNYRLIVVLALSTAGLIACRNSTIPRQYQLIWEENFEKWDDSKWSKIPRGKSPWNKYMSSDESLYEIKDGKLILRGIVNPYRNVDTARYITGGVTTKDKVGFGPGRLEIRAKLGNARGAWPAFWMLGQGRRYPEGGEIDIMEHLNHDDFVYQTVHTKYTIDLKINTPKKSGTGEIIPNDFNIFAVEKHDDKVVFLVNGVQTHQYPLIHTDQPDQFPFAEGEHYLLLDMQLGGDWVGRIFDEDLPVEMEIDWVKFYKFKR